MSYRFNALLVFVALSLSFTATVSPATTASCAALVFGSTHTAMAPFPQLHAGSLAHVAFRASGTNKEVEEKFLLGNKYFVRANKVTGAGDEISFFSAGRTPAAFLDPKVALKPEPLSKSNDVSALAIDSRDVVYYVTDGLIYIERLSSGVKMTVGVPIEYDLLTSGRKIIRLGVQHIIPDPKEGQPFTLLAAADLNGFVVLWKISENDELTRLGTKDFRGRTFTKLVPYSYKKLYSNGSVGRIYGVAGSSDQMVGILEATPPDSAGGDWTLDSKANFGSNTGGPNSTIADFVLSVAPNPRRTDADTLVVTATTSSALYFGCYQDDPARPFYSTSVSVFGGTDRGLSIAPAIIKEDPRLPMEGIVYLKEGIRRFQISLTAAGISKFTVNALERYFTP